MNKRTRLFLILFITFSIIIFSSLSYIVSFRIGSQGGTVPLIGTLTNDGNTPIPNSTSLAGLPTTDPGLPPPPPWNGADRITLLLMGLDYREWTSSSASRSDTMILLTIDPASKTAGILSIPRDLWANIPGFDPGKINTAYYFGEIYNLPGGGPGLAIATVEQTLGVPIDYYAQIDFGAFIRFIDLIGGVKVNVPETITIDPLGADRPPKTLQPGVQVLTGELTLAYARARHTPGGDFARAARQQQVILGIRDRLLNPDIFEMLISNANSIYSELASGINTNLPLEDAIRLAFQAIQVEENNIIRGIIDDNYVTYGRSPDDLAILIPIPDKIRALRDQIFATSGPYTPLTIGSSQQRLQLENASIAIYNGTSDSSISTKTANYLTTLGANIVSISSANQSYASTSIIDYHGSPYTLQFMVDILNISNTQIYHRFNPHYQVSVEIFIGSDWLNNNILPINQ